MAKSRLLLLASLAFLFLLSGIFFSNYFVGPISEMDVATEIGKSLQDEIIRAEEEAKVMLSDPSPENTSWAKLDHSFFDDQCSKKKV